MKKLSVMFLLALVILPAMAQDREKARIEESATVLKEIMNVPDNIPQDLVNKAECILVIPAVKKAAFGIGGSYGRGVMTCRSGSDFSGPWSAPAMYRLIQGSIGLQIGGQETDFVLLIMNSRGANSIMRSKVKLGADASAAGGPKGRTAEAATNEVMRAEVLSYSRSRGVFIGISLSGANLQHDRGDSEKVYGQKLSARQILRDGKVKATAEGQILVDFLNNKSPKNLSDPKSN